MASRALGDEPIPARKTFHAVIDKIEVGLPPDHDFPGPHTDLDYIDEDGRHPGAHRRGPQNTPQNLT
jgi:hypothetical protein